MTTASPQTTGVDFVCVPTHDHDRAVAFSTETLGVERVKRWGECPARRSRPATSRCRS